MDFSIEKSMWIQFSGDGCFKNCCFLPTGLKGPWTVIWGHLQAEETQDFKKCSPHSFFYKAYKNSAVLKLWRGVHEGDPSILCCEPIAIFKAIDGL